MTIADQAARFVEDMREHQVGERATLSASWLEGKDPQKDELSLPGTLTQWHIMYRNRRDVWPGFFVTGCQEEGSIFAVARDTTLEPGRVLRFFEAVCREMGGVMEGSDSSTYDRVSLYSVAFVPEEL